MADKTHFKVEIEDFIAWVTLNRPEKRNVMGWRFFVELQEIMRELDENDEARVIVIKGEGKSFSAGTDLSELSGDALGGVDSASREGFRVKILAAQDAVNQIELCRKPVIAAVHSHCLGGALDLVCACDLRLASGDALFGIRETQVAFIADLGTLQRMPHIVGHGRFMELALTGRDFGAVEALDMGFVTGVYDNKEELYKAAAKLAGAIAANSPVAVQGVKNVVLYTRNHGLDAGLKYVAAKNAASCPSEDLLEAMQAFMEKRKPVFKGR